MERFADRHAAGRALAHALRAYADNPAVIVLALPRGGVPVAWQVAQALGAPLDIFVVRKLGVPGHAELALGAVASGGVRVLNPDLVAKLRLPRVVLEDLTRQAQAEIARREARYRGDRLPLPLAGRTVIVVDDGAATGASMRAAVTTLRLLGPQRLIVAVPVAAPRTCAELRASADAVVCLATPAAFGSVGQWYTDFAQTTDAEVQALLAATLPVGRAR